MELMFFFQEIQAFSLGTKIGHVNCGQVCSCEYKTKAAGVGGTFRLPGLHHTSHSYESSLYIHVYTVRYVYIHIYTYSIYTRNDAFSLVWMPLTSLYEKTAFVLDSCSTLIPIVL